MQFYPNTCQVCKEVIDMTGDYLTEYTYQFMFWHVNCKPVESKPIEEDPFPDLGDL